MKTFSLLVFSLLLIVTSCNDECDDTSIFVKPECKTNCSLIPEVGPCNAAFKKYYFNQQTMKCDSFVWGGCNGVVPFQTMEECLTCGCK